MKLQTDNETVCGKSTLLVKHKDPNISGYIGFPTRCQLASCPECSQIITEYLKEQIAYWTVKKNLGTFLTLTSNDFEVKTLTAGFKTLQDFLKMLSNEDYFNNRKSVHHINQSYDNWVNEVFKLEWFYIWTFGKQYSKKERSRKPGAVPYTSKALEINSLLNEKPSQIKRKISNIVQFKTGKKGKWLEKAIEDYYENNVAAVKKTWSKISFTDIQNRQDYYKDIYQLHWDWIRYDFSNVDFVDYRHRVKNIEKLSFIRVLEYQKKGRPHFHILLNQYVPHSLVKKAIGKKVYDIEDLEKNDDSNQTKDKRAASYLAKYFTKETVQTMSSKENVEKLVSTSNDISITIEDAFKSDVKEFEIVKIKQGVLPQNGMRFSNESEFENALLESLPTEHPNPYIEEIKDYLKNYLIERQSINNKFARNEKALAKKLLDDLKDKRLFEVYRKDIAAFRFELDRRKGIKSKPLKVNKNVDLDESLSKEQSKAVRGIIKGDSLVNFLIGYAGAGKTFTLSKMIEKIDTKHHKVAVVSLTGKAVSRVKETILSQKKEIGNIDVSTIHRLAGAGLSDIPYPNFHSNSNNPLNYDVVIIDEYSMLSLDVLNNFLSSIPINTKLIFVGDAGQLNPVNSFNPSYYFNKFNEIPVSTYELTHNFRSADFINSISNSVRKGDIDSIKFESFDIENVVKRIRENPNLQVLTNTNLVSMEINKRVQSEKSLISLNYNYDIGDKLMFVKNDRKKRFFNGEFARLVSFDETLDRVKLQVVGQAGEVEITLSQMNDCVVPGYSITIHKSQGSEFKEVLIILDSEKTLLLSSNLLYTAITRAKEKFEVMTTKPLAKKELALLSSKQANEKLMEYEMVMDVTKKVAN